MRITLWLAVLALAACSTTPSSPSTGALNGTWRIVSIKVAAEPFELFLPPEAVYQLTFDGPRLSVRVDCNTCNGTFMTNGSALTIGPSLACTRAACATATIETTVVALLPGEHQISTAGTALTLNSSRGRVTLARR